jgi:penicillin-binding protein 2
MNRELFEKISHIIRSSLLIAVMVTLSFLCVIRLLQIQIIEAGRFANANRQTFSAEQLIPAVRGRIVDSQGRPLNDNQNVHKVILQQAFLPHGQENEVIAGVLEVLIKHEHDWIDTLPITLTEPFLFKNVASADLDRFKRNLGLNYDATVENCLAALAENFRIDTDRYCSQKIRYIGGVRYEMQRRDFSFRNRYIFAEDVSMPVIIELKEKSVLLRGVDIVQEPIRLYLDGTVLPHIRGRINAINEQQYTALKGEGYNLNDVIGFFGLEWTFESVLRGENGVREIVRDSSWQIVSDEVKEVARAGDSVKLTIDAEFQRTVEQILADHMNWTSQIRNWPHRSRPFTPTTAGSIVVLDVNTGAILALVNNPSYDLNDYVDLMLMEAAGNMPFDHKPLLDRSLGHGYRPGSSFKTVTGTAGLIHGIVDRNTSVTCRRRYTFYSDYQPFCTGSHGGIAAVRALEVSCNIYYYDVGRRLGINRLSDVAKMFGVGTNLNCDVPMFPGRMTTPEVYHELMGHALGAGDTIQAAIGQSETLLTPLHMATVAMTIANNGVRYRPYLVDSIWNYDLTELVSKTQPQIIEDFSEGNEASFKTIQDGMYALGRRNSRFYAHLPDIAAFKTGTPEIIPGTLFNSTVLGYYPADNPQIAFAIVLEGGEWSSRAIRNIIDAYFYGHYEPVFDDDGNTRYDWVRATQPRTPIPGRYGGS